MSTLKVCHDASIAGNKLLLYNENNAIIESIRASIFKGFPEIVRRSGGTHMKVISENESIVINPEDETQLTTSKHYDWYAKWKVMADIGYKIATNWDIKFIQAGYFETNNYKPTYTYMVSSLKDEAYRLYAKRFPLVPMAETIIHIRQEYHGLTLLQIATSLKGEYDPVFGAYTGLMGYVFAKFKDELQSLCYNECIPINRLYLCDFNVTFQHDDEKEIPISSVRITKRMKNVVMVPVSSLFNNNNYGNIPWTIADPVDKETILRKAVARTMPLLFFDNDESPEYGETPGSVYYYDVCILPEISSCGKHNNAGSSIGVCGYKDDTREIVVRGELFNDISTREQLIITLMYNAFVSDDLRLETSCHNAFRELTLSDNQRVVRPGLIRDIQLALLSKS